MLSAKGTTFFKDMGFEHKKLPSLGVSVFEKRNGKVTRIAKSYFGPGDDYCVIWHFFSLLPNGSKGWHPKYAYKYLVASSRYPVAG